MSIKTINYACVSTHTNRSSGIKIETSLGTVVFVSKLIFIHTLILNSVFMLVLCVRYSLVKMIVKDDQTEIKFDK